MTSLRVGQLIPEITVPIELGHMKLFSVIMADPNPIHFDPVHTAMLGMGDKPINQGTLTLSYPIDALLSVIGDPARIRRIQCRFQGSVVADDVVVAGGTVAEINDGVARVDLWLDKREASGELVRVLSGTALVVAA